MLPFIFHQLCCIKHGQGKLIIEILEVSEWQKALPGHPSKVISPLQKEHFFITVPVLPNRIKKESLLKVNASIR